MDAARTAARLGVLATLLGLPMAGCAEVASSHASGDGREAASHFLDELRAGRLAPAWDETTPEFKSLMGLENLRDYLKAHPALKGPAEYVEARDAARDGRALVEHVFRAEARIRGKAVPATVKVLVAAGDGHWGVERLSVE